MSRLKAKETPRDAAFRKSCEAGKPVFNSIKRKGRPKGVEAVADSPAKAPSGKGRRKTDYSTRLQAWSRAIHATGDRCVRCGREATSGNPLEAHHLLERGKIRFRAYRLDLRNGCLICKSCHQTAPDAAHRDLPAFRRWWAERCPEFAELLAVAAPEEVAVTRHDVREEGSL